MKREKLVEILGHISAILTTTSFIPGVAAVWKMRPAPAIAISFGMYIVISLGVAGWFTYGVLIKSWPIKIANFITFFLTVSILIYKSIYG